MTTVAQALAYSLFLAIPAAMLVALGVFSLVADAATVESLIDRAQTVMPDEAATLLRDSLRRSTESPGSGIVMTVVGFTLAIWTTTSAATTLMKGITVAFDGTESRGFLRTRLLAAHRRGTLARGRARGRPADPGAASRPGRRASVLRR